MKDVALTTMTVTSAFLVGLVMALLGSLKLTLARRPDRGDDSVRRLLLLLNLTLIPLFIIAGILVDSWGIRPMLITGSVLLTLAFLALSTNLSYPQTLAAILFAALGAAFLYIASIVQMPRGLFGVNEFAASLQLGLVFLALGALIGPPLMDVLLTLVGFRRSMAILALIFLVPAFLAALPAAGEFPRVEGLGHLSNLLLSPAVLVAGIVFFAYAPLEAFVGVWIATFLTNRGQTDKQSFWLGSFWAAMIVSRLIFAVFLHAIDLRDAYLGWFLFLPALFSAVLLGNMSSTSKPENALGGLILLGLVLGPVYPMLLSILFRMEPVQGSEGSILENVQGLQGSSLALLYAFGSLGSLVLSPLVHRSANQRTIYTALWIPLLISLALTLATLMFGLVAMRPE